MSIIKQLDEDLIKALKAGEKLKLSVLRGLKSDLKYKQIAAGKELSGEQVLEVLGSARKKRMESIEQFSKAGRTDLTEKEEAELAIIVTYLPKQMDETELRSLIKAAIAESGVDSPGQMGLVMKVLMPKVKGKADGKIVQKLVTEILAN